MLQAPRTAVLVLTALLTVVLAVPAIAAPGHKDGRNHPTKDRKQGNPVAHCLENKHDDDGAGEDPVDETTTVAVTAETITAPVDETTTPPAKDKKAKRRGIRDCVHAALKDVEHNAHADGIVAVVAEGIANGYPDATYRPQHKVTRAQMAAFLARAFDLAASEDSGLVDVNGNAHEAAIEAVVAAGIANGFGDGTYRPNKPVTRAQMAAFLVRALDLSANAVDSGLVDVDGNAHEAAIEAVVAAGIANGFGDGTYRPNKPVTRGQMATFLSRGLDL